MNETLNDTFKIALFCGGAGTRMWPMSRKKKPKQFQPLVGNESMFEAMVKRLAKGFSPKDIFVVTGREYVSWVVQQAPDIPLENIIIEPEMRDTLAAVGLAAAILDKKFDNPVVAALWGADHLVRNEDEFIKALSTAKDLAQDGRHIVEIDVRPTFPSTHLGYIQVGKMLKRVNDMAVFEFVRQIEKPDFEMAKKFVASWEYLWHVGYSCWRTKKILSLYKEHAPLSFKHLEKIRRAWGEENQERVLTREYTQIPKNSIDFAILEKMDSKDQLVISADLGWSDVGAWNILKDEMAEREEDNVIQGEVIDIGSKDCLIYSHSDGKIIATLGLSGLVIVDTEDALLVSSKDHSADIKKIINQLRKRKKTSHL